MSENQFVDFIGIGAAKAASTWIHQCLAEHPDICMADPKEPAFFTEGNMERGFGWYEKHFAHCAGERLRGEISPAYLIRKSSPKLIYETYPDIKLIVSLRNPVDRFISACNFKYSLGRYNQLDFSGNLEERYAGDIRRSRYYRHLVRYLQYFNRDQILVVFYEDIKEDPVGFMQNIYRFVGADDSFEPPSAYARTNVTSINRQRFRFIRKIYYALRKPLANSTFGRRYFIPVLRTLGIVWLAKRVLAWNIRTGVAWNRQTESDKGQQAPTKKEVTPEERARIRSYFDEDIKNLEQLLGRDLSFWR